MDIEIDSLFATGVSRVGYCEDNRHFNHSPKFWAVIDAVIPDYKERQAFLKELQKRQAEENWR